MGTAKTGHKNKLPTAYAIVIQDAAEKTLDYIRLPSCTEVTITFKVAGRADIIVPYIFSNGDACDKT